MKKILSLMMAIIMALSCITIGQPISTDASVKTKSRAINIVFDDSGSMAQKGVTSWSQAKYAMEVFAAMMGENDSMTIYPMSSYSYKNDSSRSDSWEKTISISGSEKASKRVQKIEKMNGDNGIYRNTPIQSVEAAGDALVKNSSNEKWLVILTDGTFDRGTDGSHIGASETRNTILEYAGKDNINVIYVAIGSDALSLRNNSNAESFYAYDADADNILDTVTRAAATVFNYQSIPLEGSGEYSFDADIPISKVIIFAQGSNVDIGDLNRNQKKINEKANSVDVQVKKGTKYYPQNKNYDIRFADDLDGKLVTYTASDEDHPFADGTYSFRSNVNNVEVYFEPGVDVQAVIEDGSGEAINLSEDDVDSIEAGAKTVKIRIVNPLTGEAINPSEAALLEGAELTVNIAEENGDANRFHDGDTAVIKEGNIDIYAQVKFKGDIEKKSDTKSIKVTPAQLSINFQKSDGYELDIASYETDEEILFEVTDGDGKAFSESELKTITFDVAETEGVEWTIEPTGTLGQYKAQPQFKDHDGGANLQIRDYPLTVTATITSEGMEMKGSGSTSIRETADTNVELKITTKLPEKTIKSNRQTYMFDPEQRGVESSAPYIEVGVEVTNPDGSLRKLTEEEWNAGVDGFTFTTEALENSLMWKIINFVFRQDVQFEAVKGDAISSYKLYLSGKWSVGIRPNESSLNTRLAIKLDNGIREVGETQDVISVKPLSVITYIGSMILALLLLLLSILFVVLEIRKNRFDRDMCPNTRAILSKSGVSMKAPMEPQISRRKVKHKWLPPWKAEERDITLRYPQYFSEVITFHCVATGGGAFRITNLERFYSQKEHVRFDGLSYDAMKKQPQDLTMNSDIILYIKTGNISGKLIMSFRKPDNK